MTDSGRVTAEYFPFRWELELPGGRISVNNGRSILE